MLIKSEKFNPTKGSIVLVVLDGVGLSDENKGNAVNFANTPTLKMLMENYPNIKLKAHGKAVGLPSDEDMGNSEVGHNALGSGQIYNQGAKLVFEAIGNKSLFKGQVWQNLANNCVKNDSTLHFIGLFSDGNVHSNISHLKSMIEEAKRENVKSVRVHILLDGRDVGETSALDYVLPFEEYMDSLKDDTFDIAIASGGGRMHITMDRYEADWDIVKRGWETHILGQGRSFKSAQEAIETYRSESGVVDQFMPGFVIGKDGKPIGTIQDNDSVIFFNFRGDRAIEISKAFEQDDFDKFDRQRRPNVMYAGMLEYDGDLHIPKNYLVDPPFIKNTLGENLSKEKVTQFAISETQKFGHVTYFWNGNNSKKFDGETYVEVPSDKVPFEQRPWMKCAEITDKLIEAIESGQYKFLRANFPNGDMVGHTGVFDAAVIGVESVDISLARILKAVDKAKGLAIITADHGNADEMFEMKKGEIVIDPATNRPKPKTSHTLNKVPFIIYDKSGDTKYKLKDNNYGLANVAATVVNLLGYEAPQGWEESMIE